jgi:hypothetical protein
MASSSSLSFFSTASLNSLSFSAPLRQSVQTVYILDKNFNQKQTKLWGLKTSSGLVFRV